VAAVPLLQFWLMVQQKRGEVTAEERLAMAPLLIAVPQFLFAFQVHEVSHQSLFRRHTRLA
jgi:hypothetical protein